MLFTRCGLWRPARTFGMKLALLMKTNSLRIEIYSDLICPWCYIGRHRLQAALANLDEEVKPEIHWLPFQLNPNMPKPGLDRRAYRSAKFGSWERSQEMDRHVAETGSLSVWSSITIACSLLRTPWRAIVCSGGQANAASRTLWPDKLFHAYFSEGRDVGNLEVLAGIAGKIGLPIQDVRRFLKSDSGRDEVLKAEAEGRRRGLNAVPFFVLNGTAALSGAQSPEIFVAAIRDLLAPN